MPLLLSLNALIQLALAVHAYRSRAPRYWMLVIIAIPFAGWLGYCLLELLPRTRAGFEAARAARRLARTFDPHRALRERLDDLSRCGSVHNRVALAEACLANGLEREAVELYRRAFAGAYENDPHLRLGLARALVEHAAWDDAADAVERLRRDHPCHKPNETRLLHARVLAGRGETVAALAEYHDVASAFVGLEARCRYAELLERLGRRSEARAAYEAVIAQAAGNASPVESEARWASIARKRLATPR